MVAKGRYEWTDVLPEKWITPQDDPGTEEGGPWLKERDPEWTPPEFEVRVSPTRDRENPGLHRLFARVPPTKTGVRAFAKKWGQLGRRAGLRFKPGQGYAESLAYWQQEIDAMARLVGLWELVRTGDHQGLAPFVRWTTLPEQWGARPRRVSVCLALKDGQLDPQRAEEAAEKVELICPTDREQPDLTRKLRPYRASAEILACEHEEHPYRAELFADWPEGDLLGPARYYLHAAVNGYLAGHVNPIVPLPDTQAKVDFWFVPDTLLANLYVLFAMELSGQLLAPKECKAEDCRRVFIPASTKQEYCTSMCRVRADAHRRRARLKK